MFNGTSCTLNSDMAQDTYMFGLYHLLVHTNKGITGDKAKIRIPELTKSNSYIPVGGEAEQRKNFRP